ncbi:hypothetical protein FACS189445_5410 [Spirochaetia bacterium]|nr:hypothetical protein FACS189445_5410 [Spirochaetia bacterium]
MAPPEIELVPGTRHADPDGEFIILRLRPGYLQGAGKGACRERSAAKKNRKEKKQETGEA